MTKDIKSSMDCSDVIISENGPGSTVSVMPNVEELRCRLYKAMKDVQGLLNDQDFDKIAEDSPAREGEEMVAGDAKNGSIPMSLVNQAKLEERKCVEGMKVCEVIDRKMTEGCRVIGTRWVVTNKGTAEEPNVRARWVAQEFKGMDGRDSEHHAPTICVGCPQPRSRIWKGQGLRSGSSRRSTSILPSRTFLQNGRGAARFRREHSSTMLWMVAAVLLRHGTGGQVMATTKREKRDQGSRHDNGERCQCVLSNRAENWLGLLKQTTPFEASSSVQCRRR